MPASSLAHVDFGSKCVGTILPSWVTQIGCELTQEIPGFLHYCPELTLVPTVKAAGPRVTCLGPRASLQLLAWRAESQEEAEPL